MSDRASILQTADKEFPSQGTLIDLSGQGVDASGWVWQISSPGMQISLDWSDLQIECSSILSATVAYVADLIRHRSFDTVRNTFTNLKLLRRSPSFIEADRNQSIIPFEFFIEVRDALPHDTNYRLHYLRQWYRYCCDLGAASFCEEVAFLLDQKVVGGNKKGQAVLSLDPEEGPLNDLEITALLNGLRAARETGSLDTGELAALWLCVNRHPKGALTQSRCIPGFQRQRFEGRCCHGPDAIRARVVARGTCRRGGRSCGRGGRRPGAKPLGGSALPSLRRGVCQRT